jgi:hypothetical protein
MTLTTAQLVNGGPWSSASSAGSLTVNRGLAPPQTVSPTGSAGIGAGLNLAFASPTNTGGVPNITAGFDPSVIYALAVKLQSVGDIWPIGLG